jgi:DNA-binding transcriptional regulator LsrR (DeoR family)
MINGERKSKATAILREKQVTRAEAAERLNMSVRSVDRYLTQGCRTKGRLGIYPYHRIGRAIRIPVSSLVTFMEKHVCHA